MIVEADENLGRIASPFTVFIASAQPEYSPWRHLQVMPSAQDNIAIVGSGTIGLSFAALHLTKNASANVTLFDTRPDLQEYVAKHLPGYLLGQDECMQRLSIVTSLESATRDADIVQEQLPDKLEIKAQAWAEIEKYAPAHALFWSSTSGIPASLQSRDMSEKGKTRLLVVHPFNPPHIMPLLELVPSPTTSQDSVSRTLQYWKRLGREPVVIKQECTGFVANRLAFALLREACSLVTQGLVSVEELDTIVQTSMGPRWSIAGPFKSYHAGGGAGGLKSFLDKLGNTIQTTWDASAADIESGDIKIGSSWQELVCMQADSAYGEIDTAERDEKTRRVLAAVNR